MRPVADEVLHDDVGGVGLERDAVVAIVDVRVLDHDVAAAVCVPAIGIFSRVLAHTAARDVDVGEHDICGVGDERVPLWAVAELQVLDRRALETNSTEEDGAQDVDVLRIKVVPGLAVTVEGTAAVDVDILASELEEGGGVLESLVESVLLPVVGVVGELDGSLDICRQSQYESQIICTLIAYQDRCA